MKKFFILLVLILSCTFLFTSCDGDFSKGGVPQDKKVKFELYNSKLYMAKGDYFPLCFDISKSEGVEWKSDNSLVAEVTENGMVKALDNGKCNIIASLNNKLVASTEINIADALVSLDYSSNTQGYNVARYSSISSALREKDNIIVMNGRYDEDIVVSGEKSILGVGSVYLRSIKGDKLDIKNISFESDMVNTFIEAKSSIKLDNVGISYSGDSLEGIVGIKTVCTTNIIEIKNCSLSNLGAGIMCDKSKAHYNIQDNKLGKCEVGILVDLREKSSGFGNVKASGQIINNIYQDCKKNNDFLFMKGNYEGDLDFYDFNPTL